MIASPVWKAVWIEGKGPQNVDVFILHPHQNQYQNLPNISMWVPPVKNPRWALRSDFHISNHNAGFTKGTLQLAIEPGFDSSGVPKRQQKPFIGLPLHDFTGLQ